MIERYEIKDNTGFYDHVELNLYIHLSWLLVNIHIISVKLLLTDILSQYGNTNGVDAREMCGQRQQMWLWWLIIEYLANLLAGRYNPSNLLPFGKLIHNIIYVTSVQKAG